jgi:hypothetical protein
LLVESRASSPGHAEHTLVSRRPLKELDDLRELRHS